MVVGLFLCFRHGSVLCVIVRQGVLFCLADVRVYVCAFFAIRCCYVLLLVGRRWSLLICVVGGSVSLFVWCCCGRLVATTYCSVVCVGGWSRVRIVL